MSIVASLKMQERVELDEYDWARYERKEDADAVLRVLRDRFPDMKNCIVF